VNVIRRAAHAPDRFLLFVGSTRLPDLVQSKLQASRTRIEWKRLDSGLANWETICALLDSPGLVGVVAKLNVQVYRKLASEQYRPVASTLVQRLAAVPHLLLVHEEILADSPNRAHAETSSFDITHDDGFPWFEVGFEAVQREQRLTVHQLFEFVGIEPTPYRRNGEADILIDAFVEDQCNNLLFRLYVPSGRMYEDEVSRLLELFHEWLANVKKENVRRDGYRTAAGRVYEFFADPSTTGVELKRNIEEFSQFLDLVENAPAAEAMLKQLGVDSGKASEIVTRYSKEIRRVRLDLKHERERVLLQVRQRLEAELSDEARSVAASVLDRLVNALVPTQPFSPFPRLLDEGQRPAVAPQVSISQQFIGRVEGIVAQTINGSTSMGVDAAELFELITRYGPHRAVELTTAVHQLEDVGAPTPVRLRARQRLLSFLARASERVEDAAVAIAIKYVESKVGL
jgi:hypothetical protein